MRHGLLAPHSSQPGMKGGYEAMALTKAEQERKSARKVQGAFLRSHQGGLALDKEGATGATLPQMFRNPHSPSPFAPAPVGTTEQEPRTEPEEVMARVAKRILERRRQRQEEPRTEPGDRPALTD